jgi:hypothetical protein
MEHPIGRIAALLMAGAAIAVAVVYGFCAAVGDIIHLESCDGVASRLEAALRPLRGLFGD